MSICYNYNTLDNASIVWKGVWPILVLSCHHMTDSLCLEVQTEASPNSTPTLGNCLYMGIKPLVETTGKKRFVYECNEV